MDERLSLVAETLKSAEVINNLVRTNLRDGGYLLAEFKNFGGSEGEHAAAKLFKAAPALLEALQGLLSDIEGLIGESGGVYGLHMNGDPSPWNELDEGGRFERLSNLSAAHAAIRAATE